MPADVNTCRTCDSQKRRLRNFIGSSVNRNQMRSLSHLAAHLHTMIASANFAFPHNSNPFEELANRVKEVIFAVDWLSCTGAPCPMQERLFCMRHGGCMIVFWSHEVFFCLQGQSLGGCAWSLLGSVTLRGWQATFLYWLGIVLLHPDS